MDKKYTSLEHSIRNIMTESIGAIGTDKFTKTENSFFRSFHVEPKKGDTHPNGNAIRATRNAQNERGSSTMNSVTEEDQLDEFARTKELDPLLDFLFKPKKGTTDLAPPTEAPTVPTPKIEPIKPKTDEPEPEVAPKPKEAPPVESPKKVEEPTPSSKPDAKIKPEEGAASKPGAKPGKGEVPKPKGETSSKPPKGEETPKPKVGGAFPISFPLAVNPLLGAYGGTNVRTFMHSPQEYMESTEADTIRRSIENVARPRGKNRITKQAELKAKIIDENNRKANIVRNAIKEKKAGQNPLVDTKPKLNDLELDEKYVGRNPSPASGAPKAPKPQATGDSTLTRVKNYLTDPQTYKKAGITAAQMAGGMLVGGSLGSGVIPGYGKNPYIPSGAEVTQKIDKATGENIDRGYKKYGLDLITPTGKRNPETGAWEPDDPKYKYGGLKYADVYKNVKAGADTLAKNAGSLVGLSKGTSFDIERKQEEEKYKTPKEFSITNPMSYDVDTTADVLQMVPYKPAQALGLGIAATRNVARRDLVNLGLDTSQYGAYSKLARKFYDRGKPPGERKWLSNTKFSEPLKSSNLDTIVPSVIGGYQVGTDYAKRQNQE